MRIREREAVSWRKLMIHGRLLYNTRHGTQTQSSILHSIQLLPSATKIDICCANGSLRGGKGCA